MTSLKLNLAISAGKFAAHIPANVLPNPRTVARRRSCAAYGGSNETIGLAVCYAFSAEVSLPLSVSLTTGCAAYFFSYSTTRISNQTAPFHPSVVSIMETLSAQQTCS